MSTDQPPAPPRSVRSPRGVLEQVLLVDGSFLATWGNVFIQVRRGALKLEAFEQACAAFVRHRTRIPRGALQGTLVLTEPGATIPAEVVRTRQRAFTADILKNPNARLAVVIVGEDVDASLLRSASRGVVPSHPQLRIVSRPEAACEWLSEQLSVDAERLLGALIEARALAARELEATGDRA